MELSNKSVLAMQWQYDHIILVWPNTRLCTVKIFLLRHFTVLQFVVFRWREYIDFVVEGKLGEDDEKEIVGPCVL